MVAIDGKQARRSDDKKNRQAAIHRVSAWACQNRVVLGQPKGEFLSKLIGGLKVQW